jgi:O-antigen/teichoic acid export membrane protein
MIKLMLNTTLVRIVTAAITFLVLLMNARALGPDSLGTIGLLLLAVTIILMLNNLVGGGALVFLVPRFSLRRLLWISYVWALLAAILGTGIMWITGLEPSGYYQHIFFLSWMHGVVFVNQNVLVAKERIRTMNGVFLLQYVVLILSLGFLFFGLNRPGIGNYLLAMYLAWGVNIAVTLVPVIRLAIHHPVAVTQGLLRAVFRYGFFVQIANLTQFLNYRLSYYFVEAWLGRASLGVFEVGNKLADGLWLFPKSVALVQYSVIANAPPEKDVVLLTLRLFRFVTVGALLLACALVVLPETFYLWLLGEQYAGIHRVILFLAPGMVSMSASMILAHYFAGVGKHYINTIGSIIGLGAILLSCSLLIPRFGLSGAALAASLTYTCSLIYHLIMFTIRSGAIWRDFLFSSDDLLQIRRFLLSLRP